MKIYKIYGSYDRRILEKDISELLNSDKYDVELVGGVSKFESSYIQAVILKFKDE